MNDAALKYKGQWEWTTHLSTMEKLYGDELYVRVECQDAQGRSAWTNPVYYNSDFLKYVDENYLS